MVPSLRKLALATITVVVIGVAGLAGLDAADRGSPPGARDSAAATSFAAVALAALPAEARSVDALIRAGGPFPYSKDGSVFGNRERLLPAHPRGYYREYTVRTPGSADRGARRIVCGGGQPTQPRSCYYTDDHYASFRLIER